MGRSHGSLVKRLVIGMIAGIVSWSVFAHYVLHDTATLTESFLSPVNVGIGCGILVTILAIRALDRN